MINENLEIPIVELSSDEPSHRLSWLENFFYHHREKIPWVHLFMFFLFVIILFLPLFLPEPTETAQPWSDFTVFSNYLMWAVWFPLVFLSVIFSGRSWCGLLCPMGAASEYVNRYGLSIKTPNWIRWEGMPIVAFILVTVLGQTVGVRDHKEAIAFVFGGLMLVAMIVGFIYGKKARVWCRHMCPIGLLLGLYSRLSMITFHPNRPKPGENLYRENSICPTMIDVLKKNESRHCIECFRCVNPESQKTMKVSARPMGQEAEEIDCNNPNSSEVWFFFIGTGAALGGFLWLILPIYQQFRQIIGEWAINMNWFWIGDSGPGWLMSVHPERREVFNWLDFSTIIIFMLGVTISFSIVMSLINQLESYLIKRIKPEVSQKPVFNILAYQYMPVAMIALLIGLGGKIFTLIHKLGLSAENVSYLKVVLFIFAIFWGARIGYRIIKRMGLSNMQAIAPMFIGTLGSVAVALSWWPAVFGV